MKFSSMIIGAMVAVPALLAAQGAPVQQKHDVTTTFGVMKSNVGKITAAGEKERWQANVDEWSVVVAEGGKPAKADLDKISAALATIKSNVGKLAAGAERERWQANVDLWQLYVTCEGAFAKPDVAAANAAFEKMKANVAKISEASEKERWIANRDLWRATIDRAALK